MLGRSNDLYSMGASAEENMKYNVIRHESKDIHEVNMYKEAAKRVVFSNCMSACEIDPESLPNFNKKFYYDMPTEQACLQDCYNTRMKMHFGSSAVKHEMLIDFAALKREYLRYEKWQPANRIAKEYTSEYSESYIQNMTKSLLEKSKKERYGKFDFQ